MENILILTYYYPPCTGVPAYRPFSWSKDFHKHGFNTTIITRHWNGNEKKWDEYLEDNYSESKIITNQNSKTIYLSYKKNKYLKLAEYKWVRKVGLSKLIYLFLTMSGNFHMDLDGYNCFKKCLYDELNKEKYKLIIVTSPPLNLIKLAFKANKKFNIPFVVDFQDSWNNLMLADNYKPNAKERFYNYFKELYLKKWLKKSLFITAVTPAFTKFIKRLTLKSVEIITNGFEKDVYLKNIKSSSTFFNISLMGTVHPIQDISMMLGGLNLFLVDKNPELVKLNFIGLNSFPGISKKIRMALPEKFIYTSDRVSMEESVELTLAAHVLLFPSYKGYKGYYTAKIFEYLGARRNILMIPGNNDIVDDLIHSTLAGKITNSEKEFADTLEDWYTEWKRTGNLLYHGIGDKINFFTRENQVHLLCETIKKKLT
ncbi:MAG: hypothetical protein V4565_06945 [Bacteroidota bacterium]